MNNSARKVIPIHSNNRSVIRTGSVVSIISDEIIINMTGDTIKAKKAFSCIIDPQPGDIIICSESENGMIYILGIIERPATQKMNISFPSDVAFQANQGSLNIHFSDNVTIASKDVNFFSKKVIHKSQEAIVSYDNITANGNELQASFKTVRLISNLINTMAKQVIDRFKGYIRSTEDNDMVKAGQMTRRADGLCSIDSKYTIMNSKKITKIDGEKILMG
ncbi:MAG: DUF3540 domain-containing protein [Deltaproteobacteria bacterium]|uniref:DUF3540 domain-containing protein n=1 Tax=Desulfobacula sp. TaxID=2593537 RepID=UPI0019868DF3|nr:DUF3540 domain-containing protein [Candidatus Desulfobacula maris]MBL6993057.1 DUF3540 domain-containing protein [Desulfobacula sp.]